MIRIAILLAVVAACFPTAVSAQENEWTTLKNWSGSGMKTTESFRVTDREWRIEWETSNEPFPGAGIFQIFVHKADDDALVTLAANKQGTGSDVTYVRSVPGRFYLTLNSGNVDWRVQVQVRKKNE